MLRQARRETARSCRSYPRKADASRRLPNPHRYWRGGVAAGSAVPESAGGVVLFSEFGVGDSELLAGGVLSGVAVLLSGAVCSAGGNVSCDGFVLPACCLEHADIRASAATPRINALRFIRSPPRLGLRCPVGESDHRSQLPNARRKQAFRVESCGAGVC